MKEFNAGITLIELLIVIAIVGILAAVALPYFQGYMVRARLTEVENSMTILKGAVSTYYQEKEFWPNCNTVSEIQTSLGVGLGSISRISAITAINGVITATVQNIHTMVNGQNLTLTPSLSLADGSIHWEWGFSAGFPMHLRPRSD